MTSCAGTGWYNEGAKSVWTVLGANWQNESHLNWNLNNSSLGWNKRDIIRSSFEKKTNAKLYICWEQWLAIFRHHTVLTPTPLICRSSRLVVCIIIQFPCPTEIVIFPVIDKFHWIRVFVGYALGSSWLWLLNEVRKTPFNFNTVVIVAIKLVSSKCRMVPVVLPKFKLNMLKLIDYCGNTILI